MRRLPVVLLCEDEQMACFARRFLKRRGVESLHLRELKAPAGKGSGEQWVRQSFPRELELVRTGETRALIVFTDADAGSCAKRLESLRQECLTREVAWRGDREPVLILIPARNIETWLAYLRGEPVNETEKFLKYAAEADCRDQVVKLDECCRQGRWPTPPPPSLLAACEEWKRMP